MLGGDCPASPIAVAVVGMVDQPPLCINALAIDKAMAQGPFWTMHTNHRWVYPGTGTLMPFGLGNAAATYRRLR